MILYNQKGDIKAMARPRAEVCSNCNGQNPKCHYATGGRKCRVGQAKGKAKGKAVSEATKEKRDKYDEIIGDLHTDYLNAMRDREIRQEIALGKEHVERYGVNFKCISFERWLNTKGYRKEASYLRRTYKDLSKFNFKDFNQVTPKETVYFEETASYEVPFIFDRNMEEEPLKEPLKTYEEKCKEVEEAKKELAELIEYFEENGINYDPPKEFYRGA